MHLSGEEEVSPHPHGLCRLKGGVSERWKGGGCRRSGHGWVGETIGQGMLVMTCGLITAFLDAPVVQNYLFENVLYL